jgi:beta-lactamase regulating signal transducer with metallopeptidase domain
MLQWINHIPLAIIQNLGFMALLFIAYNGLQWIGKFKASFLFSIAVVFQVLSAIHFIYIIISANNTRLNVINNVTIFEPSSNLMMAIGLLYCLLFIGYIVHLAFQWHQVGQLKLEANFETDFLLHSEIPFTYHTIKVGIHDEISSPLTFGWLDAMILLPISLVNQLSNEEVKYILLHEIAHIIRHDYLIQIIVEITHRLLYFNPFSYFFSKEINIQREMACDDWVIAQTNNPLAYTKVLYQIANQNKQQNPLPLHAIGTRNELLLRIKKMYQIKTDVSKTFVLQIGFAMLLFLFFTTIKIQNLQNNVTTKIVAYNKLQVAPTTPIKNEVVEKKQVHIKLKKTELPNTELTSASSIEEYNKLVDEAALWIKQRENPSRFAAYSSSNDSLEFEIAEKLVLRSVLTSYQLKKALLNEQLATLQTEKEAMEFLKHSKEWNEVLQYEKWTSTFLEKHPDVFMRLDSSRRF